MAEAGGGNHFLQGAQRALVEVLHALALVRHIQRAPATWILGRYAGRTTIGMANARLDAAEREHEAARGIAPVRTERHRARDVKSGDDLAGGADTNFLTKIETDQGVVHEHQAFAHRHADVIDEFHRGRTRPTFGTIDNDEIGPDAGTQHGLGHTEPFPRMANGELEPGRLAAREFTQAGDETKQAFRRIELGMTGRRDAILTFGNTARLGDLGRDLGSRQHPAMARLGALREFDFDHLDLIELSAFREFLRAENTSALAGAEVACTEFPDDVATILAVVFRQRSFAGVVIEIAEARALVEGEDGVR